MADPNPVLPESDGVGETAAPTSTVSFLAGRRKWAILVLGLLVIAVAIVLWQSRKTPPQTTANSNISTTNTSVKTSNPAPTFRQVTVPIVTDTDKDGLTDQREAELKTNPKLADSDGDGLSDYDEVTVYRTNPLVQDTDSDGFPDGVEVQSGNNPNGAGKILNLPQSITNINAQ